MKSIRETLRKNKIKVLITSCIYVAFFSNATGLAILGPSLLDLQAKTQSQLSQVTYTIVGRAAGVGIGSVLNILLAKYFHRDTLLVFAFALAAITEIACPFNSNVWLMIGTLIVNGICLGINESISLKYLIDIWTKDCAQFLQGFYLVFGLGALITPLYVRPFLVSPQGDQDDEVDDSKLPAPEDVKIHWPFIFNGILMAFVAVFAFFIRDINIRLSREQDRRSTDESENATKSTEVIKLSLKSSIIKYNVYAATMLIIFVYCGIEVAFGSYLTPFAVACEMHLSKKTAALMSSAYWASYTFGRILILPILNWLGVLNVLFLSLALVLLSNVFLFPFGMTLEWALWAGIITTGLGLSPIWASLFAFIDSKIPFTGTLTSLIVLASCLGECIVPILVSAYISNDPRMFLWIILGASLCMVGTFAVVLLLLWAYQRSTATTSQITG